MLLCLAPKHREIVEIELIEIRAAHEEGARRVLSQTGRRRKRRQHAAQAATRVSRQVALVQSSESRVVFGDPITIVAGKRLIAPLARQHDLDVARRKLRNEIERDAGRVCDRLVLVPYEAWQLG